MVDSHWQRSTTMTLTTVGWLNWWYNHEFHIFTECSISKRGNAHNDKIIMLAIFSTAGFNMSKLYLLTFLLANNGLAGGLEDELMNVTTCVETLVEQFDFHIQHHNTFFARYKNMRDI